RVMLNIGDDPVVTFIIPETIPVTVYSYCNLHGLWRISA
ncbi:MAG: desulfoferrodoxin, partial [Clostridia bacterium]|nr:desulfoferrodoxin [Clostridia bacterium]